jgi:Flp pilus assembly pilin Flp
MSNYPETIDVFNEVSDNAPMDDHAVVHNDISSAIVAVENTLGTKVSGGYSNVTNRLDANDALVGAIRSQLADYAGSQKAGEYEFVDVSASLKPAGSAKWVMLSGTTLNLQVSSTDNNGDVYPLGTLNSNDNMQITIGADTYSAEVASVVAVTEKVSNFPIRYDTIGWDLTFAITSGGTPSNPPTGTRLELNVKGNDDLSIEDIAEITRNSVQNADGKTDQKLWLGTATEYANISVKDPNTLYVYTP